MTEITFIRQGNLLQGFVCQGHAGYADKGYDIVCAAITAQVTTCINALESVAGVTPIVKTNTRKPSISATLPKVSDVQMHDCQVILKVLEQGAKDLLENYPEFIRIGG
ncbi:MAG: ribosomal-processing cysteine protease Prp [Eubacteriales bacterium]|nr:ribosomal-processing cysteine protease Prp [Eubacteriales bacterium]